MKPVSIPSSHRPLLLIGNAVGRDTAKHLVQSGAFDGVPVSIGTFQSGEPFTELFYGHDADFEKNAARIKGARVSIVQSTAMPVAENMAYLLEMVHTLKAYGAADVTVVMPFAAFARQDRAFDRRFASVAGDMLPKLLKAAGADGVVSFAMHSQAAIGFYKDVFGERFTALDGTELFAAHLRTHYGNAAQTLVIGAPDGADKPKDEGQRRARALAAALSPVFNDATAQQNMFRISKVHTAESHTKITAFDGDVAGKDCVILDDMVDGGSTMMNAARLLKEKGAKSVTCCFTHGILTNGALEKMLALTGDDGRAIIDRICMTDSIPDAAAKKDALGAGANRVDILPLGGMIAAALTRNAVPQAAALAPKTAPKIGRGR